jgi:TolA-binding protein
MGVAAAAIVVVSWMKRPPPPVEIRPAGHAAVRARPGTDYAVTSGPPNETLRLREGTIHLDVDSLRPGERFRVVTGDGEVEVRGTSFEVTAKADRLVAVRVIQGRVEVRPYAGGARVLGAGQVWRGAPAVATLAAPDVIPPAATPPSTTRPTRQRRHPSPDSPVLQEALYDKAWDAMRAGDFQRAASEFSGMLQVAPNGPLADEGAFWRSVALARAGRRAEAMVAFSGMLDAYPASPRRAEASTMLGWLLVDARQPDEAARRFRAAVDDPSDSVRSSARKGLQAIGR